MLLNDKDIWISQCFCWPGVGFSLLYAMSSYILKEIQWPCYLCHHHHPHPHQSDHNCSHDYDVVVWNPMCVHDLVGVADVRLVANMMRILLLKVGDDEDKLEPDACSWTSRYCQLQAKPRARHPYKLAILSWEGKYQTVGFIDLIQR